MKAVILAAGVGSRLGYLLPKPLTPLKNKKTILDFQIEKLINIVGFHNIIVVVGYKHTTIMKRFPKLIYVYNPVYAKTSTSKSLLFALNKIYNEDVIYMNGDVFFDEVVLKLLQECNSSCCLVDKKRCKNEEMRYSLNQAGFIKELSKKISDPVGEALGINLIKKEDLELFKKSLEEVSDKDYFEKALENLMLNNKIKLRPVNVGNLFCEEIDFPEDLKKVKRYLKKK